MRRVSVQLSQRWCAARVRAALTALVCGACRCSTHSAGVRRVSVQHSQRWCAARVGAALTALVCGACRCSTHSAGVRRVSVQHSHSASVRRVLVQHSQRWCAARVGVALTSMYVVCFSAHHRLSGRSCLLDRRHSRRYAGHRALLLRQVRHRDVMPISFFVD